jgi:hypothetical protein
MADEILDAEPSGISVAKRRASNARRYADQTDENLYWSEEQNGWVVGRPNPRPRSPKAGRKRYTPDGLPPRMYERKGKFIVSWWVKDPDSRTRVLHRVPASSSEEELSAARNSAIERANGPNGRVDRAPFRSGANWVANYGRTDPKALVVRKGLPRWARAAFTGALKGARARNIDWLLSVDDMAAIANRCGGRCEVSGVELTFTTVGRRGPYGPSVDRIDSNFAYTPRNTRIVCVAMNYAMNTWGVEPLIPIFRAMAEKYPLAK